ncbi:CRISPR-associated helicase Cas3' [Chakrabartyella piscis]|uniref:CRISPR-associated helicase Cas3' n=1 Tax=Chakrabartyella piscis TaxID=2918914 RepID=UPI002958A93B|nr:CRISPR-associated helicase Cas3' [Chakrabartyella piscis]
MQIAHIKENGTIQTIQQHSESTAEISSSFAISELRRLVYQTALIHDLGKYQPSFQKRISGENHIKIPHALCGAIELKHIMKPSFEQFLMQYCIAGHHTGLQDFGNPGDEQITLLGTLEQKTESYEIYKKDISFTSPDIEIEYFTKNCRDHQEIGERFAFLTRYVFSCITDADSLDTEAFCTGVKREKRNSDFSECLSKIEQRFAGFQPTTDLQKARSSVQNQVYEKINQEGEIFLMPMPTGSGKTLCSMKFALERAIKQGKKRIIYIIPYNSIIDQTAQEFERIFGDSLQMLRHQSNFQYEVEDGFHEDYRIWANKAIENWDGDFIITTAVQFFESIHHNKRGKLRKLHNMADAILIFDEAHLMPTEYLSPCLKGISHITSILNSEAVFLTATMPDFHTLLEKHGIEGQKVVDLVTDTSEFSKFRKCDYINLGYVEMEQILSIAAASKLIVVNSRKKAQEVYENCDGEKYHLSTYMTVNDRQKTITTIRERLEALEDEFGEDVPEDKRVTVVSTSLIEAGVDLDFHVVCRELAGLDHILQAGGRCNREGKRKGATAYIFAWHEDFGKMSTPEKEITKGLLQEFSDLNDLECIQQYYERMLRVKADEITKHKLKVHQKKPFQINFKEYTEGFKFIEDNSYSIVIVEDVEELQGINQYTKIDTRKYQKYMASVKPWEFEELFKQGVISDFGTGVFFLTNLDYYNKETGILFAIPEYII